MTARPFPNRARLATLAIACAAAAHGAASADDFRAFSFSGYGTVGLAHSSNDQADYLVDEFKPNGPGFTHGWSSDVDTRLGAQVSAQLAPRVSAVVQVISQQRYDNTYRPEVEWANVKYQFNPDLSVRAGRIVLPIYMVTDSRRVGYANPWVRPPIEVYSLVPVTHVDGVDANYRAVLGEMTGTLQATYATSDSRFPSASGFNPGTAKARGILALVGTVERGFLTLRANWGRAELTIEAFDPLADAFRQFGPPGQAIVDRYGVNHRKVDFTGVGAMYDPGTWFATGEWARFSTHSVLGSKSAWYVSAGHRLGAATPYLTYARIKSDTPTSDPGIPLEGLPPAVAAQAAFLNQTLNQQLGIVPVQHTISAGVRWDFMRNAALKLQLDEVHVDAPSHGTFGNIQAGFQPGSTVRIVSAVVDFVF
jgi:hypothetical protein